MAQMKPASLVGGVFHPCPENAHGDLPSVGVVPTEARPREGLSLPDTHRPKERSSIMRGSSLGSDPRSIAHRAAV